MPRSTRRGVELFAGEFGVVDAAVLVHLALLRVPEHAVHLLQRLKLPGGVGVLVGVQPERRLVVRLLDLRGGRLLRQAQDLVQIAAVQTVVAAGALVVRVGHLGVVALGGGLARVHLALAAGHRAPRTEPFRRTRAEGGASSSGRTLFSNATLPGGAFSSSSRHSPFAAATRARDTPHRTSRTRGPLSERTSRSSTLLSPPTLSPERTRSPPRRVARLVTFPRYEYFS